MFFESDPRGAARQGSPRARPAEAEQGGQGRAAVGDPWRWEWASTLGPMQEVLGVPRGKGSGTSFGIQHCQYTSPGLRRPEGAPPEGREGPRHQPLPTPPGPLLSRREHPVGAWSREGRKTLSQALALDRILTPKPTRCYGVRTCFLSHGHPGGRQVQTAANPVSGAGRGEEGARAAAQLCSASFSLQTPSSC